MRHPSRVGHFCRRNKDYRGGGNKPWRLGKHVVNRTPRVKAHVKSKTHKPRAMIDEPWVLSQVRERAQAIKNKIAKRLRQRRTQGK